MTKKQIELGGKIVLLTPARATVLQTIIHQGVYVTPRGHEACISERVAHIRRALPPGWHIVCEPHGRYKLMTSTEIHQQRAPHHGQWTEERFDVAAGMWREGFSARVIAEHLNCGITRNAVIGKMSRAFIEHGSKKKPEPAPEPEPEIFEPPADPSRCREFGCPSAPMKYYSHGYCLKHNQERLAKQMRRSGSFEVTTPLAGV